MLIAFLIGDLRIERLGWSPAKLGPDSHRLTIVIVWALGAVTIVWLWRELPNLAMSTRLIVTGLSLGLATSALSDDPNRSIAIGAGFVIVALATGVITVNLGRNRAVLVLMSGLGLLCAISLIFGLYDYNSAWEISEPRRLTGILAEPNSLGQFGGLLAVLSGAMWAERKIRPSIGTAGVVLGAAVAAMSLTRTIGLALLATVFVVGLVKRPKPTLLVATMLSLVAIMVLSMTGVTPVTDLVDRGQGVEELTTFSNRLDLWDVSLDEIAERPLLGHGFASGPRRFELALEQGRLPWIYSPSSHNLLLEIAREIGLPALLLVGIGTAAGVSAIGFTRPAMLTYLATAALLMPTSGVPGTLLVAWIVATIGSAAADSGYSATSRRRIHSRSTTRVVRANAK